MGENERRKGLAKVRVKELMLALQGQYKNNASHHHF